MFVYKGNISFNSFTGRQRWCDGVINCRAHADIAMETKFCWSAAG